MKTIGWNQSATKTYKVRVSAVGYDDLLINIRAGSRSLALGTNNRLMAILEWEKHNGIEDCETLPSVTVVS